MKEIKLKMYAFWFKILYGTITSEVKSIDGGHISEIAYKDRNGIIIGYWAYGSFDPSFPYRGQDGK